MKPIFYLPILCICAALAYGVYSTVATPEAAAVVEQSEVVLIPPPIAKAPQAEIEKPATPQSLPTQDIRIITQNGEAHDFTVELAVTAEQQRIGMMHRPHVPANTGMMFVFQDMAERSFWMKDTPSPLDILFIDDKGIIVSIHPDAVPNSLDHIHSNAPVQAGLEIGGGQAAALGIDIGDRVVVMQ